MDTAKKTYFISDLHLGARYVSNPREHEAMVVRFLDNIKHDAKALYMLGDVLDYWFEYRTVVPRGHVRFLGKLAELADAGVNIYWLTGNHDVWLRDYVRDEIGLTVYYGSTLVEIDGQSLFISHGDDVGEQPLKYRFTRKLFYSPVCQWLYGGIHPRWSTTFATKWSSSNRTSRNPVEVQKEVEEAFDALKSFAIGHAQKHPDVKHYVFGHLHFAKFIQLDHETDMVCLGDWIGNNTYATLHNGLIELHHWQEKEGENNGSDVKCVV